MRSDAIALTPSQAQFLARKLDEVDLSVRASNCLKNINVTYLGELVQFTPEELLRTINLGRKSLAEIIALFAEQQLSLGLCLPDWRPYPAGRLHDDTIDDASALVITPDQVSRSLLTASQHAFLCQRLDEIDLSVRTSNCLKDIKVKYLGDLVQHSPRELLSIHNFGKKSLQELVDIFASVNLELGLHLRGWTPDSFNATVAQDTHTLAPDVLTSSQEAFLAQPLSRFHLSKRVMQILNGTDILRVGDLAILSMEQAGEVLDADRAAIREVMGFLASENLYFGLQIPCWNANLATEWEHAHVREMHHIHACHAIRTADTRDALLSLEDELEQLVRRILNQPSDRRVDMIIHFFGFDGTGKKTLEQVGTQFGVTRERVRQITTKFAQRLRGRIAYLPIFRSACNLILDIIPASTRLIAEELRKQQISRTTFDVSGIIAASRLLDEKEPLDIVSSASDDLVVREGTAEWLRRVPRIARTLVSAFGCGHLEHVVGDLEPEFSQTTGNDDVVPALNRISGIRWLGEDRQWFTILGTKRNRLSNIVRKVLSVADKVSLSELRGAIKRVHRLQGFAPPTEILRDFCSSLPFCRVDGGHVVASASLIPGETLGEVERCFRDVLRERGPAMALNTLRDECLRRGMNGNSFYQYITYSPIISRLVREVYALVGAEIPPGIVEEISRVPTRVQVLVDHGWTDDGRVWISYRLNASNLRSGVFSLPTSLNGVVSGDYFIQSSGTGVRSVISAENDRLTGLHRPVAIRGGEPGDVIVVTFDLREASVELRFGGDVDSAIEPTACQVASTDAVPAPPSPTVSVGVRRAINDEEEWQPIDTAPPERDLKVRLEDSVGRYALLFPCKLVPGQGWMNSWLESPLTADPVDWRNWDEPPIDF